MSSHASLTPSVYLTAASDGHLGHMIEGHELAGFNDFFGNSHGWRNCDHKVPDYQFGWRRAERVCYAQGVLACTRDEPGDDENPYEAHSPAWAAWAEGFDDAAADAFHFPTPTAA